MPLANFTCYVATTLPGYCTSPRIMIDGSMIGIATLFFFHQVGYHIGKNIENQQF
jgi:hypothetical protein